MTHVLFGETIVTVTGSIGFAIYGCISALFVSKFAENAFSAYTKSIYIFMYRVYTVNEQC